MICPQCGMNNHDWVKKCGRCGNPLSSEAEEVQQQEAVDKKQNVTEDVAKPKEVMVKQEDLITNVWKEETEAKWKDKLIKLEVKPEEETTKYRVNITKTEVSKPFNEEELSTILEEEMNRKKTVVEVKADWIGETTKHKVNLLTPKVEVRKPVAEGEEERKQQEELRQEKRAEARREKLEMEERKREEEARRLSARDEFVKKNLNQTVEKTETNTVAPLPWWFWLNR